MNKKKNIDDNLDQITKYYFEKKIKECEFISKNESIKIKKYLKSKKKFNDLIIIELMYDYGLNINEILGLTIEDIMYKDNISYIYIRNRLSDNKEQIANRYYIPNKAYNNEIYLNKRYGYDIIYISKNLYDMIQKYIDETDKKIKIKNYEKKLTADTLYNPNMEFKPFINYKNNNRYIFVNNRCELLRLDTWNQRLSKTMNILNIKKGSERIKNDINICFVHGYAMEIKRKMHLSDYKLSTLLHTQTDLLYYDSNYTDEEEIKKLYKEFMG